MDDENEQIANNSSYSGQNPLQFRAKFRIRQAQVHTPVGIMRAKWDYRQWQEATAGRLLFSGSQARRIHEYVQSKSSCE